VVAERGSQAASAPAAAPTVAEPSPRFLDPPPRVLVDSGPLIALFNAADRWHAPVRQWLQAYPTARLLSTWPVATEVCALLARRIHNGAALDFLRWAQRGGISLDHPGERSLADVLAISERFASLPFDLADASIAESAARLKIGHILSIDADFDIYRDRAGAPLVNLLRR
jgi:hypothetical protein